MIAWWRHDMERLSALFTVCERIPWLLIYNTSILSHLASFLSPLLYFFSLSHIGNTPFKASMDNSIVLNYAVCYQRLWCMYMYMYIHMCSKHSWRQQFYVGSHLSHQYITIHYINQDNISNIFLCIKENAVYPLKWTRVLFCCSCLLF